MNLPEKAKNSLNKVLEKFKNGDLEETIAKSVIEGEGKPCQEWSLKNRIIMRANETEDARGYKQWKEVGRYVEKGASAFYIFGPIIDTVEEEVDGEVQEQDKLVGFTTIPVFRAEDTKGEPLPDYEPEKLPPLIDVLDQLNYEVNWEGFLGSERGHTRPGEEITLKTYDERTFFHELGHACHNELEELKGGQHKNQEVIAEGAAAVLLQMYGMDNQLGHSKEYIERYSGDAYQGLINYLSGVEKVLNFLLGEVGDEPA